MNNTSQEEIRGYNAQLQTELASCKKKVEELEAANLEYEKTTGFVKTINNLMDENSRLLAKNKELERAWKLMRDDRDKWKRRVNEPYDDSVIAELEARVKPLQPFKERIIELEAALRAINIYSRNTPGGTSSELGRIARKALLGKESGDE